MVVFGMNHLELEMGDSSLVSVGNVLCLKQVDAAVFVVEPNHMSV